MTYKIVSTLPHDTSYFLEGIEFQDSTLIESTGNYGESRLVQYQPATGKVLKNVKLEDKYFGEGVTVLHDTVYQLTYKESVAFAYTLKDFRKVKEFPFKGEGWGMTNDGKNLIVSNGTSSLYYYDPNFNLLKVINVTENGDVVPNINELEYIDGYVYANQWQMNYIVKIEPSSGKVVSKLDLTDIINQEKGKNPKAEYMNGIAYNHQAKKFYITGKNWSQIYEIQF